MNGCGEVFRIVSWGESHGKAVGVVVDGCPAGLPLCEKEIRDHLRRADRPIPELATARAEPNEVEVLSGLSQGRTLGTPLCICIRNRDYRPGDYNALSDCFRPGHGDYTYHAKYGLPLPSGGGRASGREAVARLAAGYVARKLLKAVFPAVRIEARIAALAGVAVRCEESRRRALEAALQAAAAGDSSGGEVELLIDGVAPGLGDPVFGGLDARLACALMSIGAVKAVEVGSGRACAVMRGSGCNDPFRLGPEGLGFATNHSGGVLSGISSGAPVLVRLAVKPTPSIAVEQTGADLDGRLRTIAVKGRHDHNITPRIVPIAEAMTALVLVDLMMLAGRLGKDRLS
jgi:chorismate synthase